MSTTDDITDGFLDKGIALCDRHNWNFLHLALVMMSESGIGAHVPNHANPNAGAVGLIQFMPFVCSNLFGMTPKRDAGESSADYSARCAPIFAAARARMLALNGEEQLQYVEAFFLPWARFNLDSAAKFYWATFLPGTLVDGPTDLEHVLCASDSQSAQLRAAYNENTAFDKAKKGFITVGDLQDALDGCANGARGKATADRWAEFQARVFIKRPLVVDMSALLGGIFLFVVSIGAGIAAAIHAHKG